MLTSTSTNGRCSRIRSVKGENYYFDCCRSPLVIVIVAPPVLVYMLSSSWYWSWY
jgi:hypothetical protein